MITDDSDLDATVKELTSEDKALMVSNSNNFFKKCFSRFRWNNTVGNDSGFKGGNPN